MIRSCVFLICLVHVTSRVWLGPGSATLSWMVQGGGDSTPPGAECVDGVCSLPGATTSRLDLSGGGDASAPEEEDVAEVELTGRLDELVKLGWSKGDAEAALKKSKGDVAEAANLLTIQEESNEAFRADVVKIRGAGWNDDAASSALRTSEGNVTAALELLQGEEAAIQQQFEGAVQDMLQNGWDEVVARRALLAQWTVDQRKSMGMNQTLSAEQIAEIRPTLKRVEESNKTKPTGQPQEGTKKPTPASKESCVFEVTVSNFQKVVLESPVPVLVDVYADWCGPCKQLGPILENAAIQSGGMFRLAKVNSDNERAVAEALQVSGLPTVFSVNNGKFTDRFVGMLPQEQLQAFLVRAVTGYGKRVQSDVSDTDLRDATNRVASVAGLASVSFKAREKLRTLVDDAMALQGAVETDGSMSAGAKTAILYINNAAKSVREAKFRTINCSASAYVEKIVPCPAASKLLEIAGFRPAENATTATLSLVHSNSAVLTLVSQRAVEFVQKNKYASIRQSTVKIGESKSFRRKGSSSSPKPAPAAKVKAEAVTTAAAAAKPKAEAPVSTKAPSVSAAALSASKKPSSQSASSKSKRKIGGTHTLYSTSEKPDDEKVEVFGGDSTVMEQQTDDSDDEEEVEVEDDEEEEAEAEAEDE